MDSTSNSDVWLWLEFMAGIGGEHDSNSCLDVWILELIFFFSLDSVKLVTCMKTFVCVYLNIDILFCTHNNIKNSKYKMERKWAQIQILLFGCTCNLRFESKGIAQFQFMFGCTNHEIGCFVEFGQCKFVYMYEQNSMCIFKYWYIILHT